MVKHVALVLGGGGSAGHAWTIGVIAGLAEAGVDMTEAADLVIGTSSGATAAAHVRSGIPPRGKLRKGAHVQFPIARQGLVRGFPRWRMTRPKRRQQRK
jgi:NTE family protein